MSFHVPNGRRVVRGGMATTPADGNNGAFLLLPVIAGRLLWTIASDGEGWEHVSVTVRVGGKVRTPTWEEMSAVKAAFWDPEDVVMQLHPAASQHVNFQENCLHLWRPTAATIPTPHSILVGPRSAEDVARLQGTPLPPAMAAVLALAADGLR